MFLVCGVVRIGLTKIDRRRVQQILDIPSLLLLPSRLISKVRFERSGDLLACLIYLVHFS